MLGKCVHVCVFGIFIAAMAACPDESSTVDASVDVGGDQAVTDAGGDQAATDAGGDQAATDVGGDQAATDVGGDQAATDVGGDQAATDTGGDQAATDTGGDQVANTASFATVWSDLLIPQGCTAGYCHGSGAGGLDMSSQSAAYDNLVGVDAFLPACSLTKRVVAGEPDQSIVWLRARNPERDPATACVDKMPQGSTGLAPADAQLLKDWIAGGALP